MKVTLNSARQERKLVAVLGAGTDSGIFFRSNFEPNKVCHYVGCMGTSVSEPGSLEDILTQHDGRKPVYEGDTVTLQF